MTNAFISYSVKDEEIATKLHNALTTLGIPTFMAGISIEPGENWTDSIFTSLKQAEWVFFVASKSSCASNAVQQELGASLIEEKTIIPILTDISPEELPAWIDRYQAIDIKQAPELLHQTIEKIAAKIQVDKFWAGVIVGALIIGLIIILKNK